MVEDVEAEFLLRAGDHASHRVRHVGVIARSAAVAEDGDWFSASDELREFMNREVRSLARAVHGEEAQHRDIHAVNVMVNVPERFAGQLARGVG